MINDRNIFAFADWRSAGVTLAAFFLAMIATPQVRAQTAPLFVDFDGGDTTPWALTNSSGDPAELLSDGPTGTLCPADTSDAKQQ